MYKLQHNYINGQWQEINSSKTLDLINPNNEEVYAQLRLSPNDAADNAINCAKAAFALWQETTPQTRLNYVKKILEIYKAKYQEMAQAVSQEMGAPIDFALNAQAMAGMRNIEIFIENFNQINFAQDLTKINNQAEGKELFQPMGLACLITPWNWPINQITKKVIPALLAGCCVILKPSEIAPLSANIFAEICHQADLPKGVFNMLHGNGNELGNYLSSHPLIDIISFTGSTRAGKQICRNAAENLTKVTLELGGKGANLIFADSDVNAVKRGVLRCFANSGQSCNSPTRMLIERSIYETALQQAKAAALEVKLGYSSDKGEHIGPIISKSQYQNIQKLIQSGLEQGAKLLIGGAEKPEHFRQGYFIKPTIFYDVTKDMDIFKQEIFGPVLSIIPFEDEEHAVQLANDTNYGLTNYIQSQDPERCNRIAKKLQCGMVEINGNNLPRGSFFGGVKYSGLAREGGKWGIKEFLINKAISKF